jgi:5-methylcytosine-specific restriction endonuclease McrA
MSRSEKMLGNTNGKGNKGRVFSKEIKEKMRLAKLGKPSKLKGTKLSVETREKISIGKRAFFAKDNPNYKPYLDDDRKRVRRERIKIYGGSHSIGEWEHLKALYNWTCPKCWRKEPQIKLTRDHIVAVSKGGSDNIENIQPLCVSCNSKKSTRAIRY